MKNKTVKLITGVVVLGVLCGAYGGVKVYVDKQEAKEEQENESETIALCDIEADDLASIKYTVNDEEITLTKKDDSWVKDGDEEFPLDQSSVETAVDDILGLEADRQIDDVEDLSEYDLDSPQNQITLTNADGDETVLYVGMKYESGNQYYIKKADDDSTVYLVGTSAVSPFMTTLYDMAESETFPTITSSNINKVEVDKEDSYTLTEDISTLKWTVTDEENSDDADSTAVSDLTSAASSLAYDQFIDYNCTDDSEYGLDDPYATITIDYTEEEEVEASDDSEAADDSEDVNEEETTDTSDDAETTEDAEDTDAENESEDDDEESEDTDESTADSEETKTITVNKTVVLYVGDEAEASDDSDDSDAGRYVKVEGSDQVYTMTDDTLTTFLDKTSEDFYSLSVSSIAYSMVDTLDIEADGESHTIEITSEVTEEESDSDDEDSDDSTTTTTTTYTYSLDGEEVDSSDFSTFYNKLVNMSAQKRLTEEYKPENDAAYVFTFNETDGTKVVVNYYEYDSSFYAAVVDDKVYLVNKMDVRDMADAYQSLLNSGIEEDESAVASDEETADTSEQDTENTEESDSEESTETDSTTENSDETTEETE